MATKKSRKMSSAERRRLKKQLTELEQQLRRELQQNLAQVRNTSAENPTELLDMAADGEMDSMSAVSAEARSATIDEIRAALRKLREGTYGVCEACGRRIRKRRLKARPFATLCLSCKERQERLGYLPAPSALTARADADISVNLTDEDRDAPEPVEDVFREVEDIELSEMF